MFYKLLIILLPMISLVLINCDTVSSTDDIKIPQYIIEHSIDESWETINSIDDIQGIWRFDLVEFNSEYTYWDTTYGVEVINGELVDVKNILFKTVVNESVLSSDSADLLFFSEFTNDKYVVYDYTPDPYDLIDEKKTYTYEYKGQGKILINNLNEITIYKNNDMIAWRSISEDQINKNKEYSIYHNIIYAKKYTGNLPPQ